MDMDNSTGIDYGSAGMLEGQGQKRKNLYSHNIINNKNVLKKKGFILTWQGKYHDHKKE